MKEKIILAFGNPELDDDKLALDLAKEIKLPGFSFVECTSSDSLLYFIDKDFIILDVVKGTDEVALINDLTKIKNKNITSLHDFDVGFFLKLLEKMGKLKNVKILAIPQKGDQEDIKKEVIRILKQF